MYGGIYELTGRAVRPAVQIYYFIYSYPFFCLFSENENSPWENGGGGWTVMDSAGTYSKLRILSSKFQQENFLDLK